ncbi:MAG: hypothetical protein HFE97_04115 [Oscillospiraceae bacterium]|nr:hypothetical protein [Oscillospiraceae bacterium]
MPWTTRRSRDCPLKNRGIALLCETQDKQEGTKAFVQKRVPVFHGI